jgi:predicted phage tail protein
MLRTVHLHGRFSSFHDGPITVTGSTVAEIVEGITRQLPGFRPHPIKGRVRIKVVGFENVEDLFKPLTEDQTEIHIVPQMCGGKKGGFIQILIGAALIAAGLFTGGATWLGGLMIKFGAMALLGGLAQLLAPQPEDDKDELRNRYLGAPRNTVAIGTRIAIPYGRRKFFGHYLSFDINATTSTKAS